MKKRVVNVFSELLRNSKKSDRDIAKKLNISQPTVTRIRRKLESSGYISEYTIIPNFPKLGFEICAFIFFNANKCGGKNVKSKAHNWIAKNPSVLFSAAGDGIRGKNCAILTLHKNFTDYTNFLNEFKLIMGKDIGNVETFLVSLETSTPKFVSFKSIADLIGSD
jgi:DNA-binding Lrp family transcriptional regulator